MCHCCFEPSAVCKVRCTLQTAVEFYQGAACKHTSLQARFFMQLQGASFVFFDAHSPLSRLRRAPQSVTASADRTARAPRAAAAERRSAGLHRSRRRRRSARVSSTSSHGGGMSSSPQSSRQRAGRPPRRAQQGFRCSVAKGPAKGNVDFVHIWREHDRPREVAERKRRLLPERDEPTGCPPGLNERGRSLGP